LERESVLLVFRADYIVDNSVDVLKESFDNNLTPLYALVIAIWGQYVVFVYSPTFRMTEDRDKWRKYVHSVANPRIEDG